MARGPRYGLAIAGGGAAAGIAALVMARRRPDVSVMLVGEDEHFGGDRTLLVHDDALTADEREIILSLGGARWDAQYVAFPGRSRKLRLAVHAIEPGCIDRAVRETLRPPQYRRGAKIVAVRDQSLLLAGGETITAEGALDARDTVHLSTLELGWRKSAARTLGFASPHPVDLPVAVDATLEQGEGCRYFSLLPLAPERLQVEEVIYSAAPDFDAEAAGARVLAYAARRGWKDVTAGDGESDVAPVALGGDFAAYWRLGGARVAKLGVRGGFFHPTTGCQGPDALRTALFLAAQRDLEGAALHDSFEACAAQTWKRREAWRSFNRSLLGGDGCRPLAALYDLDPALIARFFGDALGLLDRRRILAIAAGR
jgi:lycopene beta-cyclase